MACDQSGCRNRFATMLSFCIGIWKVNVWSQVELLKLFQNLNFEKSKSTFQATTARLTPNKSDRNLIQAVEIPKDPKRMLFRDHVVANGAFTIVV